MCTCLVEVEGWILPHYSYARCLGAHSFRLSNGWTVFCSVLFSFFLFKLLCLPCRNWVSGRWKEQKKTKTQRSGCRFDCETRRFSVCRQILTHFFLAFYAKWIAITRLVKYLSNSTRYAYAGWHPIILITIFVEFICNQLSISCTPLSIKALTCSCSRHTLKCLTDFISLTTKKKWNFYTFKMPDGKAFSVCWRGVHLILMELAALFESVVALSTSRRDSIAEILLMLKRLA